MPSGSELPSTPAADRILQYAGNARDRRSQHAKSSLIVVGVLQSLTGILLLYFGVRAYSYMRLREWWLAAVPLAQGFVCVAAGIPLALGVLTFEKRKLLQLIAIGVASVEAGFGAILVYSASDSRSSNALWVIGAAVGGIVFTVGIIQLILGIVALRLIRSSTKRAR